MSRSSCSNRSSCSDRAERLPRATRTSRTTRTIRTLAAVLLLSASLSAHHGSADYDVEREVTVTGTVQEWRWMQPHTWVMLSARSATNAVDVWSGEGPPLTWATQRGWSAVTLRPGETVSLVMY